MPFNAISTSEIREIKIKPFVAGSYEQTAQPPLMA